jgi:hypothetical protein
MNTLKLGSRILEQQDGSFTPKTLTKSNDVCILQGRVTAMCKNNEWLGSRNRIVVVIFLFFIFVTALGLAVESVEI